MKLFRVKQFHHIKTSFTLNKRSDDFMGFIYKITNNINQKSYIGKTERSIEVRYKEHLRHRNYLNLPLYKAFNKYGIENFSIS